MVYRAGSTSRGFKSRTSIRARLGVMVLSGCVAVCASAQAQTPEDSLYAFYAWVLAHPSLGLPASSERTALAALLSPTLIRLLESASATQAKCVESTPRGDKPLIVEGDLFVGNYEGATEIAYGTPRRDGDTVLVESDLAYVDQRFPKAHKHRAVAWKDRVEIRLVGKRWVVEDVRFSRDRTLIGTLEAYIAEGRRACAPAKHG